MDAGCSNNISWYNLSLIKLMSQPYPGTAVKPVLKVYDARSYSQKTASTTPSGLQPPVQNAEEMSSSKITRQPQNPKSVQFMIPASKPQPTPHSLEQSYKQKIQQLESRLGEENKYLRETTQNALKKLQSANMTLNRIKKEKQQIESQNNRLINQLERKNISAKELTEMAEKMRKENIAFNMKIADMNATICQYKNREQVAKDSGKGDGSETELKDRVNQLSKGNAGRLEKGNSTQKSSNLLYPPDHSKQLFVNTQTSRPTLRHNFMLGEKHSIDRISAVSRQDSLNNSKRSSRSRSNIVETDLSPKQTARMEVLFDQIGTIKSNLGKGGKMSQSIANKLFSLVNHLTSALNKRNDDNVELKKRLMHCQQIITDYQHKSSNSVNLTFQSEEISPIYKYHINRPRGDKHLSKSIGRPRSSYNSYVTAPSKNQSLELIRPGQSKPYIKNTYDSRNQSVQLTRSKYNYVYRKMSLDDYLRNKIQLVISMELVTKITEIVQKNLVSHPKLFSAADFYVLYCDGECPNNLKIRVELKHLKSDKILPVSQLEMMESLGYLFQNILNSVKLQTFQEQNLFDKSVAPAFSTIIQSLKANEKQRLDLQNLKLLLQRLKY